MIGKTLSDFYRSKEWEKLLKVLKVERLDEHKQLICAYCGRPITRKYDCIGHHQVPLTEDNYTDADVSLNPDNIVFVHHKCHNLIHDKLARGRQSVYIVYGSPMSGKSSYVNGVKSPGDLIVSMDSIWNCVSGCVPYIKPPRLNAVAFGMRDYLLECVKYRRGRWQSAYIIGGYPLISERERLARELGAELVFIDTAKEECIDRLMNISDGRNVDEWKRYIDDWWERYTPL